VTPGEFAQFANQMREAGALVVEAHGYRVVFPAPLGKPVHPISAAEQISPVEPSEKRRRERAKMLGFMKGE